MRTALVSGTECRLAGWRRTIREVGVVREPPLQLEIIHNWIPNDVIRDTATESGGGARLSPLALRYRRK
jgi:hypothetical protein